MPFHSSSTTLPGALLDVCPHEGFGWHIVDKPYSLSFIELPAPFEACVVEALIDGSEVRALVAAVTLTLQNAAFSYASFIPRTDDSVDLAQRSVGCNFLITRDRPFISNHHRFPDPRHIDSNGYPHVRGFGRVSLRS